MIASILTFIGGMAAGFILCMFLVAVITAIAVDVYREIKK